MKKVVVFMVLLIMSCSSIQANDDVVFFNFFDSPFPASPYKGVVTACMRVRNAVELLFAQRNNQENVCMMCDVVAGRLAQLDAAVEQWAVDFRAVHPEDIEYVQSVIGCMGHEICQLGEMSEFGCVPLLKKMTTQVNERIEKAIAVHRENDYNLVTLYRSKNALVKVCAGSYSFFMVQQNLLKFG